MFRSHPMLRSGWKKQLAFCNWRHTMLPAREWQAPNQVRWFSFYWHENCRFLTPRLARLTPIPVYLSSFCDLAMIALESVDCVALGVACT